MELQHEREEGGNERRCSAAEDASSCSLFSPSPAPSLSPPLWVCCCGGEVNQLSTLRLSGGKPLRWPPDLSGCVRRRLPCSLSSLHLGWCLCGSRRCSESPQRAPGWIPARPQSSITAGWPDQDLPSSPGGADLTSGENVF